LFITLEGPEGAGKSTLARALGDQVAAAGRDPLVTFEPGGTTLGRQLRDILLHGVADESGERATRISPRAETLLFCSARAQLVDHVILPHLKAGGVVICDRYADSTLAYQCFGRGLPLEPVRTTLDFATGGLRPDLTILLDLDVREGLRRKLREPGAGRPDRFESQTIDLHERVRHGYLTLAAAEPGRWLVVDADQPAAEIAAHVWPAIERRLGGGKPTK
jgi:dTMP kinase